jgi:hypothetical protein
MQKLRTCFFYVVPIRFIPQNTLSSGELLILFLDHRFSSLNVVKYSVYHAIVFLSCAGLRPHIAEHFSYRGSDE